MKTKEIIPESAVLLSCGKCGDFVPLVMITGDDDEWNLFLCSACFKDWNVNYELEVQQ